MTKMPKQLQASELTPNIHAKGIGFPLGVSWKAFRIPDEWLEEVESDYGGILVAVLPGRTRLLETFAKREERDRALARRRRHEQIMAITREIALSAA